MKPKSWKDCPYSIRKLFLWNCENLDYDPYESSKSEAIHSIQCGNITSEENEYRLKKAWENITEEQLQMWYHSAIWEYTREIELLEKTLKPLKPTIDKI
jgi:hypothetical protein